MTRNIKGDVQKQGTMNNESVDNNDGKIHSAQQVRPANKNARKLDRLAAGLEIIQLLQARDHASQDRQPHDIASTAHQQQQSQQMATPSPAQHPPALADQQGKRQLTTNQWMRVIDTMVTGIEENMTEDEIIKKIEETVAATPAGQVDQSQDDQTAGQS